MFLDMENESEYYERLVWGFSTPIRWWQFRRRFHRRWGGRCK